MIALAIILGITGLVLIMVLATTNDEESKVPLASLGFVIIMGSGVLTGSLITDPRGYHEGQIDALNNTYKYEKVYTYRVNDTMPIDSAYIKIK